MERYKYLYKHPKTFLHEACYLGIVLVRDVKQLKPMLKVFLFKDCKSVHIAQKIMLNVTKYLEIALSIGYI